MFKRLSNLVRGFFGLFVSNLEGQNPEALMELEKENLRKQIANYNQGLASHAGFCERLISQVRRQEAEEKDMRAKTAANLRAGNKDLAGQYALRLQTVTAELKENRTQAEQAEKTYQELIRAREVAVRGAQAKIDALKSSLSDLKIKQATAELNEMASGMIGQIGSAGDTLGRLTEIVDERREKAAGRARVAKDSLDLSGVHAKAAEQQALADQALADFAAAEGMGLPDGMTLPTGVAPGQSAAPKTMGPQAEAT